MTAKTKTLYAYRPKSNHNFMIVCNTLDGATLVSKAWLESNMPSDKVTEFFAHYWELITLTVEEDDL